MLILILDFVEIETPLLFKHTSEGAAEFSVPTKDGKRYALPQSPQQYKQLLIAGGFEKYFQIAKCFRDEDLRSDRQPEFTQIDIEMAFADESDIKSMVENLLVRIWTEINLEIPKFEILSFDQAINLYGSDKPDLRVPLKIDTVESLDAQINGNVLQRIRLPKKIVKKTFSKFLEVARIGNCTVLDELKLINGEEKDVGMEDYYTIYEERPKSWNRDKTILGQIRDLYVKHLIQKFPEQFDNVFKFLWIVDFPLFTSLSEGELKSTHHPFTAPKESSMLSNPVECLGRHYDLVLNGCEIGGGSVRIHSAETQLYIFKEILKVIFSNLSLMQRRFPSFHI